MPKRSADYNEMIAKQLLEDFEFAREFILVRVNEEKLSIQEALAELAKKMGQKEFANRVGTTPPRVTDLITGNRKLKLETLQDYLTPFGLRLDIHLLKAS